MVALWALADVALVTSLREGVNLGAMEFVACQQNSMHGVLLYRYRFASNDIQIATSVSPIYAGDEFGKRTVMQYNQAGSFLSQSRLFTRSNLPVGCTLATVIGKRWSLRKSRWAIS